MILSCLIVALSIAIVQLIRYSHQIQRKYEDWFGRLNNPNNNPIKEEWFLDESLRSSWNNVECDFPIVFFNSSEFTIHAKHLSDQAKTYIYSHLKKGSLNGVNLGTPIILRNLTNGWKAHERWEKSNFVANYGDRVIRSGTESSIVYSGGNADTYKAFQDIAEGTDKTSSRKDKNFVFDTTILESIPELWNDFEIPSFFRGWDSKDLEDKRSMWHMLSLGASRTGLPFHNHGQTWLAVVHGWKRWFVYPPGFTAPLHIEQEFDPSMTVWDWYTRFYPNISTYSKPEIEQVLSVFDGSSSSSSGNKNSISVLIQNHYRPWECIQHPGDILYLPAGYDHMTLNIGDTIAVGGQEGWSEVDRWTLAEQVLQVNPTSYEALKDAALGLLQMTSTRIQKRREQFHVIDEEYAIMYFKSISEMKRLIYEDEDTWLAIQYCGVNQSIVQEQVDFSKLLLEDMNINIAILQDCNNKLATNQLPHEVHRISLDYDEVKYFLRVGALKDLQSSTSHRTRCHSPVKDDLYYHNYQELTDVFSPSIEFMVENIVATIDKRGICYGSIGMKDSIHLQESLYQVLEYAERGLLIRPMHPELLMTISHLPVIDGLDSVIEDILLKTMRRYDEYIQENYQVNVNQLIHPMSECLKKEIQSCELISHLREIEVKTLNISVSMASLYQKLAAMIHDKPVLEQHIPVLLGKSLLMKVDYISSWRDFVVYLLRNQMVDEAQFAIDRFEKSLGKYAFKEQEAINDFRGQLKALKSYKS